MGFHKLIMNTNAINNEEIYIHATCSVSLLFSKYYLKLYIDVNKRIADSFFISIVKDRHPVTQIKSNSRIFNFTDLKFFESAEISEFGWVMVNY